MNKTICMTIFASALLVTPHAYTMNTAANKTAGYYAKLFAKKLTSGTFSTLHWTVAASTSFLAGIQGSMTLYNEEAQMQKEEDIIDANRQTTDFIKSEIQKISSEKVYGVKIFPERYDIPMAAIKKNIAISQSTANEITEALETNNQEILNKWRGTLAHEESHRRHNDLFWRSVVGFAMPFATHGSVKVVRNIIPIAKKIRSFGGEQFIKIPTAFGKAYITHFARMAIDRSQEQRADNEVPNDKALLNGLKSTLVDIEQTIIKKNGNNKWKRWGLNFFEQHPLPAKRIKKLDQRIALLEKQSQNNS
jgi:hypothetical protein